MARDPAMPANKPRRITLYTRDDRVLFVTGDLEHDEDGGIIVHKTDGTDLVIPAKNFAYCEVRDAR